MIVMEVSGWFKKKSEHEVKWNNRGFSFEEKKEEPFLFFLSLYFSYLNEFPILIETTQGKQEICEAIRFFFPTAWDKNKKKKVEKKKQTKTNHPF